MDYKEILKGVVKIINTTEKSDIGFANICTYIGENCPELKESEDERIRKALIDYFDDANKIDENPLQGYDIHTDKVIAWLEKQGEQEYYCTGVGEHKESTGVLKQLLDEEKSWSKEDELMKSSIEQVINCASLLNIVPEKMDKIKTWLKQLKYRIK